MREAHRYFSHVKCYVFCYNKFLGSSWLDLMQYTVHFPSILMMCTWEPSYENAVLNSTFHTEWL